MRTTISRALVASAALLAVAAVVVGPPAVGQEATPSAFEATAAADGVRAYVQVPGAPLSANVFDGGAPVTQAYVNGTGESVGFASTPYPGDTAVSVPGLVLPLVGLPAPPAYPLQARSEAGTTPEASASAGAVDLEAKSTDRSSEASSTSGGGDNGGTAAGRIHTVVTAALDPNGGVASASTSTVESFSVAGILRIGATEAKASAKQPVGGAHATSSSFAAEGVSAAGVAIGVSNDGLTLPGQKAPVPDTSGLSPALDAAGIKVHYLAPREVEGGIISAGLEITVPVNQPGRDPMTVTYVLGRARAIATSSGDAVAATDLGSDVLGGDDSGLGAATPVGETGSASGALSGDGGALSPSASPSGGASLPGDSRPSPRAATVQPAASTVPASTSAAGFYLVLVVGAAVAFTGGLLVRIIGVRLAWTS